MKKIYLFILLLILPVTVFARTTVNCNYSLLSKLKKYASNVNFVFDYRIENNDAIFTVTITNVTPDIYILDEATGGVYNYESSNNGEIVIGNIKNVKKLKYKILSRNSKCMDEVLSTQYITLPVYNKYSADPLCDGIEDLNLCYTFLDTTLSYDEFKEKIEAYKNPKEEEEKPEEKKVTTKSDWDKFLDFMLKYGIYIVAGIAIIITIISVRISRKNQFDFKL